MLLAQRTGVHEELIKTEEAKVGRRSEIEGLGFRFQGYRKVCRHAVTRVWLQEDREEQDENKEQKEHAAVGEKTEATGETRFQHLSQAAYCLPIAYGFQEKEKQQKKVEEEHAAQALLLEN